MAFLLSFNADVAKMIANSIIDFCRLIIMIIKYDLENIYSCKAGSMKAPIKLSVLNDTFYISLNIQLTCVIFYLLTHTHLYLLYRHLRRQTQL